MAVTLLTPEMVAACTEPKNGVHSERRASYGDEPALLRRGGMLKCPQCETVNPEWRFEPRPRDPRYAAQTVPVLRCPACKQHFALKE